MKFSQILLKIAQLGSKFYPMQNKLSKTFKICQSGEILPNLVTLILCIIEFCACGVIRLFDFPPGNKSLLNNACRFNAFC